MTRAPLLAIPDFSRDLMTRVPLLTIPDFSRNFLLETDASGDGLGAVVAQKFEDGIVHPIAYASRTLQPHKRNYGVTELEALGVVWAVKNFCPYLYGHECESLYRSRSLEVPIEHPTTIREAGSMGDGSAGG